MRIDGCNGSATMVAAINKIVSYGVEPVCLLGSNPTYPWATSASSFGATCGNVAKLELGKVHIYGVLNEPDLHGWTPDTYLPYLKACYTAIKAVDPSALVCHAGMWKGTGGYYLANWIARIYALGGRPYFDAWDSHLYDDPNAHGSWSIWDMTFGSGGAGYYDDRNVRSIMNANGDSAKPIVATEAGGPVPKYTESQQATIVTNALHTADGVGTGYRKLKFTLIYNVLDDDVVGFGLLRPDRSRRPAWDAFRTVATA
jgi:hypothetical protein